MKKCAAAVLTLLALAACRSPAKKDLLNSAPSKPIDVPKDYVPAQATPITSDGASRHGRFSRDGSRIIFQSSGRPDQKNSQIYVYWLATKKEKRITYNDGEDSWPEFSPDARKIIYASNTDELKEHPEPSPTATPLPSATSSATPSPTPVNELDKLGSQFPDDEIYESDADGSHILRLTHSMGFDGQPSYFSDGRRILFTSIRSGPSRLYVMDDHGRGQRKFLESKEGGMQGAVSPDGKTFAWIATPDGGGSFQIFTADRNGRHVKQITQGKSIHWTPAFSPDGTKIIYSSNRDDVTNFEIYVSKADGTCVKRLTYSAGADIEPQFSPDGKTVLFTSNRSGTYQLYLMNYIEPADCAGVSPF